MPEPVNLTPAELAARLRCAVQTLANWRHQGKGPRYIKTGSGASARVRYPLSAVEEWERQQTHGADPR